MGRGGKRGKIPSLRRSGDAARRTRLREIAGVGFLALTVAAIIALASYSPYDPSFNVATGSGRVHNYLGAFGSHIADLLVQLFGFGAWLFPIFCFGAAVLCFTGVSFDLRSRLGRAAGLTGFSLALVALGNLAFSRSDPLYGGRSPAIPAGGMLGEGLTALCRPLLSGAGSALFFTFLLVASFTLATHLTPRRLAAAAAAAASAALGGARRLWGALAYSWELRRGRRAKAEARSRRAPSAPEELSGAAADDELLDLEIAEEDLAGPMIVQRPPVPQKKSGARPAGAVPTAGSYALPPLELLDDPPADRVPVSR
jgi:S-DNA-T family DNA segregation ATPase FtsK/SpoIIIE